MENPNLLYELAKLLGGCCKLNRNYIKGHNREPFYRERTVCESYHICPPTIFWEKRFGPKIEFGYRKGYVFALLIKINCQRDLKELCVDFQKTSTSMPFKRIFPLLQHQY